jgi:lipopolysaccharide export system permease protein
MKTLYTMILKVFIPMFLWTIFFFVLVFELVDVFAKLPQYIGRNSSLLDMTRIALLYVPKCIMYSLPIALLFSITFTMGNYYMNNELVSIYSSGISLYKLIIPFFVIGIFLSFFMFFFEERAAIPSLAEKNRLYNRALGLGDPNNENNVAVKSVNDKVIYQANYYNDANKTLTGVIVIERDDEYNLVRRVDADSAEWDEGNSVWVLRNCHIFEWDSRGSMFVERDVPSYTNKDLTDKPRSFQNLTRNIDEMEAGVAYDWVMSLKNAGREYQAAMSEFYKKFSFALTPFIITLISCSIGGFLKKNVLLMSLFLSICIVVVYYVIQMMAMTFASLGIIPPFYGAWSSFFLFLASGVVMVRLART